MKHVILASQSPRRKELMEQMGIPFEVIPSHSAEIIDTSKPLSEAIALVAYSKAKEVFLTHPDSVVIGSDTIVTIDNRILGKPKDNEEALKMLEELNGRVHQVITGVAILSAEGEETFSSVTDVEFYAMEEAELEDYVKSENLLDKAGAYAIQGQGYRLVKGIHGDYYTVVGLPIALLAKKLKKYL